MAPASLSDDYQSPDPVLYLILGLTVGFVGGALGALFMNRNGRLLRSPADVGLVSNLPLLGNLLRSPSPDEDVVVVADRPQSPDAEAYRRVRVNLQFVGGADDRRVVAISSPLEGEGKTSAACNIAAVLASSGNSVVLVDADLRRSGASERLGVERSVGLSTVASRRVGVFEALQRGKYPFDVLSSGPTPPNPSELLASKNFGDIISALRGRYDYVIVDCAPILPVADTVGLSLHVDGIVVVCRYGMTSDRSLRSCLQGLSSVDVPTLGYIMNAMPSRGMRELGYGYGGPTRALVGDSNSAQEPESTTDATYVMSAEAAGRPSPHRREGGRG